MSADDTMKKLRRVARKRERAIEQHREANAELRDLVVAADAQGVSITQIAREAGLSRQGIYELLGRRPS